MQELLQLPLQVQATLVAGYLGYVILKRDYRNIEKTTDVWMLILVLGMPTALIIQFYDSKCAYLSVFIAPLMAIIWIKWLENRWRDFLHEKHISHRINEGNVWKTLSSDKNVQATQIKLFHENGKCYCCHNTLEFINEPFAPFIMDDDGIAFYVSHVIAKDDDDWEEIEDVKLKPTLGSIITYFPRSDIKLLEIRYIKPNQKILEDEVTS